MISPSDRWTRRGIQGTLVLATFILSAPLLYLTGTALQEFFDKSILRGKTILLLVNSLEVAGAVTLLATTLGFVLAFLTVKTDLPGKKYWQIALILPLSIPSYIGAIAYTSLLAPRGLVYDWIGLDLWNIYGKDGVIFVLTVFTFPYSYLICRSRLKELGTTWEESAFDLGKTPLTTLSKVVIPLCLPALTSSALLIGLYVLADFGSIALLRYNTFTTAIFYQLENFHQQNASILGLLLLSTTSLIIYGRDWFLKRHRHETEKKKTGQPYLYPLGWYKWPGLLLLAATLLISLLIPLFTMFASLLDHSDEWPSLWKPLWGGFAIAIATATITTLLLPLINYGIKILPDSPATKLYQRITSSLYGIPSVLTALGVILISQEFLGGLYGTLIPLICALAIRFFPVAVEASQWEYQSFSRNLIEASYNLGRGHIQTLKKVFIPLTKRGIGAGFLLVFVGALKELPLQLLLRPPGFQTLSVELWTNAQEAFYGPAALYGLLMISLTTLTLPLILKRY